MLQTPLTKHPNKLERFPLENNKTTRGATLDTTLGFDLSLLENTRLG
jgi:hypothetical protein